MGREYRIRSDADEAWLQNVAGCVDSAMTQIRERTGTVDTLDVAILTALNLAREMLALRAKLEANSGEPSTIDDDRLHALIDLVESAVEGRSPADGDQLTSRSSSEAALLDLPTGDEVDSLDQSLLGPLSQQALGNAVDGGIASGDGELNGAGGSSRGGRRGAARQAGS